MIKKLLFTTSIFLLFCGSMFGQVDQDGLPIGTLECNNLDPAAFESDLEDFLANFPFTGTCSTDPPEYQSASFVFIDNPPFDCDQADVEIEIDIDCTGSVETIVIYIDIEDNLPPVAPNPSDLDFIYECGDSGSDPQTELDNWIANIENNAFADGDVEDNCDLNNVTVTAINGPYTVDLTSCSSNEVQEITVTFEMEDECNQVDVFDAIFTIEDNNPPVYDGNLDFTYECGDNGTDPQTEFDAWVLDIETNAVANLDVIDDCDNTSVTVVCTSCPHTVDVTSCSSPEVQVITATFEMEDLCGNIDDFDAVFTIEDTQDPQWLIADGDKDETIDPCDLNGGIDHEADFLNWVDSVIADAMATDAEDGCTDPSLLMITSDVTSISIDFDACEDPGSGFVHEELVEFTVEDLCGNTATIEHTWRLVDTAAPTIDITGWTQAAPFPECGDLSSIETAVETALTSGVVTDGCADLTAITIDDFIFPGLDPTNLSIDDLTDLGGPAPNCYEVVIEAIYEDPCENQSNTAVFTFIVEDNEGPELGNLDIPSINQYCPMEIENETDVIDLIFEGNVPWPDITDNCTDTDDLLIAIFDEFYPEECGENGYIEWEIFDACGNPAMNGNAGANNELYRVEWTVTVNPALDPLDWMGDPEDFLPPGDFTIQYTDANCTSEFDMMPASGSCMWEGILDGETMQEVWIWQVVEGVHYAGGCDVEVIYSHVPCADALDMAPVEGQVPAAELVDADINSVLTTEVCVTLRDNCNGQEQQYCWNVTVQCGSCGDFGNIYCATCEDADVPLEDGGCKLCDPAQLAEGYASCTPPCEDPACPISPTPPQPATLCDVGGFVPHNMSWFAFVASAEDAEVEVFIFNCVGAGVQSGIYPSCEFDEPCVGFNVNCTTNQTIEYDATFNVGQTYYMFVDGCNGSECEYEVTVEGLNELVPDDMDHLTAFSECKGAFLTDDFSRGQENASVSGDCDAADKIYVCPGELIQFGIRHQGNIGNFPDNDRPCDEYPLLNAVFQWSSSWGETWDYNPFEEDTGFFIDPVEMPQDVGTYTMCLDVIAYECYPVNGPQCVEIEVEAIEIETYEYKVCYEELDGTNSPTGWDPILGGDDPNMDGIEWLGDFDVTKADVEGWTERGDGYSCMDWIFIEPECNCEVPQELCIDMVGDEAKTPVSLYLWTCQVTECDEDRPNDCEPAPYEWVWDWNGDEVVEELHGPESVFPFPTFEQCFRIPGYHPDNDDWRSSGEAFCDTIPEVTVFVAEPEIIIDSLGCGAYCLQMDDTYDNFSDDFEDWPQPFQNATSIAYVDCDDGTIIQEGECLFLTAPRDNICIAVTYQFEDGAWYDDGSTTHPFGPIITECNSIDGPFDWGQEAPNPPNFTGDDTFCATALTGHVFTIDNPNPELTYIWNANPVMPGVVVTDISANGDGSEVSIDLPAGWGPNDCTNVIASGSCGASEPSEVCFNLLDPPTVTIAPITDVCITGAPDGSAIFNATATATALPAGTNYIYTWMDPSPTTTATNTNTFSYPSPGVQTVTVSVTDTVTMCTSLISPPQEFDVIEPLEPPTLTCSEQGEDFLIFEWTEVTGATGYILTVDGTPQNEPAGATSITVDNLGLGQTVVVTITSIGASPCFNSAASVEVPCTTQDCPPNGVIVSPTWDNSYCLNDPALTTIDLTTGFDVSATNGTLTFSSVPAGAVTPAGEFDPSSLGPDTYVITAAYNYGATSQCNSSFPLQIELLPVPDPAFTIESPICVTQAAEITGGANNVYTYQGGGTPNTAGEIEWPMAGTYDVTGVANVGGCIDSTTQEVVVVAALADVEIECTDSGLDFVNFEWDAVTGATNYIVTVTDPLGETVIDPYLDTEYSVTGLNENDSVEITVEAVADLAGCNSMGSSSCTATACEPFPSVSFNVCEEVPGMVTFSWNTITGIDSFIVTDLATGAVIRTDALDFTINGLGNEESASISVEPIHPTVGCTLPARDMTCTAPCPDEPVMGLITCDDAGLDFVSFDWEDVAFVLEYEVTISINGRPSTVDTVTVSNTSDLTFLTMLDQDDEVDISVIAINPDPTCGNSAAVDGSCVATSCVLPNFNPPSPVICFTPGDGPIQLEIGDVVDNDGNVLTGTVVWDDNNVDHDTGEFTPSTAGSREYDIDFTWIDGTQPDDCQWDSEMTVQVNVRPTASINDIDAVCIGDTTIIGAAATTDPAVTYNWDFAGGNVISGDANGPYQVIYDANTTISLTTQSAPDCISDVDMANIELVEPVVIEIICASATNETVRFEWNYPAEALAFSVSVDGGAPETTFNNFIEVTGITTGSSTIRVDVIFAAAHPCGDSFAEMTCPTQDCPPAMFDNVPAYDLGCLSSASGFTLPGAADILQGAPTTPIVSEDWVSDSPAIDQSTGVFDPSLVEFVNGSATIAIRYEVVYSDGVDDCAYSTSFEINVKENPIITAITPNNPDCILDEIPSVTISAAGGTEPYMYSWIGDPMSPIQSDPTYVIPGEGSYDMMVTDANMCTAIQTVEISGTPDTILSIQGASQILVGDSQTYEFVLGDPDLEVEVSEVIWYIDDVPLDPSFNLVLEGLIEVYGTNFKLGVRVYFDDDCFLESDTRVNIIDLERWYIPNVISPSLTGEDASWAMFTKGSVSVKDVSVYDRWGELVFVKELDPMVDRTEVVTADGTSNRWDLSWTGTWGDELNRPVEIGVYVYVINLVINEGSTEGDEYPEIESGDLTIIR